VLNCSHAPRESPHRSVGQKADSAGTPGGPLLAIEQAGMFRAAAFSIVLMLAFGQNARLLCTRWCEPSQGATSSCHQREAPANSASVVGVRCHDSAASDAFLIENVRRDTSASQAVHAPAIAYPIDAASVDRDGNRHGSTRLNSVMKRPLETALRI